MPNGRPLSGANGAAEFASSAIALRRIDYWLKAALECLCEIVPSRATNDARGRDGGVRQKLAARMKKKKEHRVYLPRVLGSGQVMMQADLKRLHKYMLEIEHISVISDEVRTVVEEEWPELAHKLPPKKSRG
jgi:hypothetical protein